MIENINWYPGHMKKTRELIAANLKLVHAVVEVCDARIPISSRNPIVEELIAGKLRVLVLNKSDLADEGATKDWLRAWRNGGRYAVALNSMTGEGLSNLISILGKIETQRTKQGALRIMIVGVPNSGKSSLINRLTRRHAAQTGDRPGVTRGKQWLTLENGMQLLDTPGILWPKFEDPQVGLKLAFCGSIKDEIMDAPELALELVKLLSREYPTLIPARYGIAEQPEDALTLFEAVAKKRGCILSGGRIDYERAAHMLLGEFREGKLGRVSLEQVGA